MTEVNGMEIVYGVFLILALWLMISVVTWVVIEASAEIARCNRIQKEIDAREKYRRKYNGG